MRDERYSTFAELAEDATDEEKAIVLELLKEDTSTSKTTTTAVAVVRYLSACMISIAVFLLEMLRISVSAKEKTIAKSTQLFCSSSERNTTNFHLQRLIEATNQQFDILILESPLKRFSKRLADFSNVRICWCRTIATDVSALVTYLGYQHRLLSTVVRLSKQKPIGIKILSMALVRLLRGASISQYLEKNRVERLVFSLSGNACTSMIELKLKDITKTVHWLHGVGLGFNFDAFADETLVNNEYDYQFYNDGLSGCATFFPDNSRKFSMPARISEISAVVIYSNLIHPSSEYFKRMGMEVERELLNIVSANFSKHDLVLKPHPSAIPLLGNQLGEYLKWLKQYGFRIETQSDDFAAERTLYISTVSTSFIDLISAGKCVFIYDNFANKLSAFQDHVRPAIRFRDEKSFDDTLDLFDSPNRLNSALEGFKVHSQEATFAYLLNVGNQTRAK